MVPLFRLAEDKLIEDRTELEPAEDPDAVEAPAPKEAPDPEEEPEEEPDPVEEVLAEDDPPELAPGARVSCN